MSLETLLAKDAIRDLVLRYCRAIDRRDYGALAALYHEDATDDHSPMYCGSAAGYLEWLPSMLETMTVTSHMVQNHLIEVDGQRAEGEVVMVSYHLTQDENGNDIEIIIGGRYLDKYECRDGVWRFSHRKIVMDWNQIQESTCQWDSPMVEGTPVGSRCEQDPAHTFFDLLRFSRSH
ncbi:3-phenylpropionate/cinnamic acid dioxygenase small subunit [Litorivivens lipolytica]|uniref:3-phenylpropionate/cinnamic acid dioxygenase small subunit n=1 Tax=Litorivivens lipolytica TaxID=1524264 RepID=A0A7W4W6H8_9GAMM|nr:nuclear transport factor 2 family protein [Litorivivens lipolytica]MBB3048352.1 3-phenylpropionate/cinnamic acid dioxygenase small subunit [Litorivivens lipolytica]